MKFKNGRIKIISVIIIILVVILLVFLIKNEWSIQAAAREIVGMFGGNN